MYNRTHYEHNELIDTKVLAMWAQRPIVEKHHRYAFYRPFTETIASIICDLPTKLATAIMFNVTLYFMTNLRRSAGAFFIYLVFLIVTILTMSMFFRTVGSLSRTAEQSMVPSSMVILIFSAYTGYIVGCSFRLSQSSTELQCFTDRCRR